MIKKGKEGKEWDRVRKELKVQFEKDGIIYCELRLEGCRIEVEGFAHSVTRNNLGKWASEERTEKIREVIAVCNSCHDKIEKKPDMEEIVKNTIRRRNRRLARWKKI